MELIRDNVKIEWEAIGEGYSGDYNPKDPFDVELLRFYVSVLRDGVWEEKEDGSYCTLFPANATDEEQMQGLQLLMDNFHPVLFDDPGAPIKKLGERMSWISLDNIGDSLEEKIKQAAAVVAGVSTQERSMDIDRDRG